MPSNSKDGKSKDGKSSTERLSKDTKYSTGSKDG